jgi:hypothetical protein
MKRILLLIAAMLLGPLLRAGHAATMYGVGPFEVGVHSNLYEINEASGATKLIGDTGFERMGGLAFNAAGVLYGYTPGAFYTINTTTGAATRIGLLGVNSPEGGLAFQPGTGVLYGVSSTLTDTLLTIDTATGVAATVGNLGSAGRDVSGLAFSTSGVLYGVAYRDNNPDNLVTINTATGAATTIGALGTNQGPTASSSVGGLEFDPDNGILYYSDSVALYTVNTASGLATLIGPHGVEFAGLAAAVPEPAALAIVPLVAALFMRRR